MFAVLYDDQRVDKEMKGFDRIEDAIISSEMWIINNGYSLDDFEKYDWREKETDGTALMAWHCEFGRSVEIFAIGD